MNYIDSYTEGIRNGSIIVGKWIRLLYEYIADGLKNKSFFFDQEQADEVINFIESHCYHTEGALAPNLLKLELWQKALVSVIFGIVDDYGNRQFREIVLLVARKNGKSLFASAIMDYVAFLDGEYGAEIYCLAPKLEQAEIVYSCFFFLNGRSVIVHQHLLARIVSVRDGKGIGL